MRVKILAAVAVILLVAGCASKSAVTGSYMAATGLTAAELSAAEYVRLPPCSVVHQPPACSDDKIVGQIDQARQAAYAAVKQAEASGSNADLVAANAAVAALVSLVPAKQTNN